MIKKNRKLIPPPKSLDPTGSGYLDENANNFALVNSNIGKPWSETSPKLVFKLYASSPDVKHSLSKLFGNKCAYCECSLDNQDLHTEHFRPKGKVSRIDNPTEEGYWWLAADWENLLPACIHCNRSPGTDYVTLTDGDSGKGNRFPILPASVRAISPGQEKLEKPGLLDPTLDEPSFFVSFKELNGESVAYPISNNKSTLKWMRADSTINIIGLNRSGLVRRRNEHLLRVKDSVEAYLGAAKKYSVATKKKKNKSVIAEAKAESDKLWGKLYDRYLSDGNKEFLHATIRCIESEFAVAGLSLNRLLGGNDLYIPGKSIS